MECLAANRSSQMAAEDPLEAFASSEAAVLKEEIVRAGKKQWERQYVDGRSRRCLSGRLRWRRTKLRGHRHSPKQYFRT